MSFKSLGLPLNLLPSLADNNYLEPYPIQTEAIPAILQKKDVLAIAKTGSGKTASYVLPILSNLQFDHAGRNRHVSVLVLVPTRELAMQVEDVFKLFANALPHSIKCMAVYGGVSINPQMIKMQGVDVLIATPGRLLDLVDSGALHLAEAKTLVLDEADKLLNLGFSIEINRIFDMLPRKRQNLLFSATLNDDIRAINQLIMRYPKVIKIEEADEGPSLINQIAYNVEDERKGPLLRHLIKSKEYKQVLVFTSSVDKADKVSKKLNKNGINALAIHSKQSQGARINALRKFKAGDIQVLVSTDLLARGIDIEFLPCVINYELPRSPKDYIHRIGRTGRAANPGDAISFLTENDVAHFKVIQRKMGTWVSPIETEEMNLHGF